MTALRILRGIEFAKPQDAQALLLDLYLPGADRQAPPQGGRPAVIHFHGGGWRTGERSSLGPVVDGLGRSPLEQLADAGFVVASADCRLTDVATFPAQLLDAKAAVRWLRVLLCIPRWWTRRCPKAASTGATNGTWAAASRTTG